jgi:hypothetical protein
MGRPSFRESPSVTSEELIHVIPAIGTKGYKRQSRQLIVLRAKASSSSANSISRYSPSTEAAFMSCRERL